MHACYIEAAAEIGQVCILPREESKHAARVLRLKAGDEICAMDGAGSRFLGRIEQMNGDAVAVKLLETLDAHEAPVRVTLYQGIPKADKLDFIAQKLTELGAAALTPVRMDRCVAKWDDRDAEKRRERLSKIAREAAKQCGRACAPEIATARTWRQALEDMKRHDLLIVPWEEARVQRMKDVYTEYPHATDIGIVVGPEGGMSEEEVQAMLRTGAQAITLGPRILRTETAAMAAAAMAMTLWGDL